MIETEQLDLFDLPHVEDSDNDWPDGNHRTPKLLASAFSGYRVIAWKSWMDYCHYVILRDDNGGHHCGITQQPGFKKPGLAHPLTMQRKFEAWGLYRPQRIKNWRGDLIAPYHYVPYIWRNEHEMNRAVEWIHHHTNTPLPN